MTLSKRTIVKDTRVQYMSHELLFLAKSGQPYRGTVYVNFVSIGETFELLDFKKYITTLRDKKLNAEDIAYEIFNTIDKSVDTKDLGVIADLTARGGIQQRICFGTEFNAKEKENIFQVR
jgi:NADPH-dependent 7-cyano-7-deazaguanine reductase QueF